MSAPVLHAPDLDGQSALVTGASSGIGRAVAAALAREGVGVTCFDLAEPSSVVDELVGAGGRALGVQGGVHDEDAVREGVSRATAAFGAPSIVVNCAGVIDFEPIETAELDDLRQQLAVNLIGPMLVLKHALPAMRRSGAGSVVLFGSVAGKTGGIRSGPAYGAAKGGVHALVKWAAHAYGEHGVRINAVAPGPVDTPMTAGQGYTAGGVPLGRLGVPTDIREIVVYLASSVSGWVTGQTFNVNGGVFME